MYSNVMTINEDLIRISLKSGAATSSSAIECLSMIAQYITHNVDHIVFLTNKCYVAIIEAVKVTVMSESSLHVINAQHVSIDLIYIYIVILICIYVYM
jgi:hypothetical protein